MSLRVCQDCRGFMAASATQCPHCRVGGGSKALRMGALTLGATLAIAIYVPGCAYGCPEGACGDDSTLIIDAGDVIDGAAVTPDAATGLLDAMPVVVDAVPI